ncbi:hypothetical protein KFE25_005672 [Diacronema lutheri]|uniref:Uncharacterized protein n=1 Tax=Diacronema lutheri TaxID=2081491 RepID=A0A8J5X2G2_DIALT|nr:hypothetical protein KFE25_005672 [Diacronema lutheri]
MLEDRFGRALDLEELASELFVDAPGDARLPCERVGAALAHLTSGRAIAPRVRAYLQQRPPPAHGLTFDELVEMHNDLMDWLARAEAVELHDALCRAPPGFAISDPSMRGITVAQLRRLLDTGARLGELEKWNEPGWAAHGAQNVALTREAITTHNLLRYLATPLTARGARSFVEAMSSSAQRPEWLVCHALAQPVAQLLRCLEQHARDHGLDVDETPYWLAAYALKLPSDDADQPPLSGASRIGGGFVGDSDVHAALRVCHGAVLVLEAEASVLSSEARVFETCAAIVECSPEFRVDVYTALGTTAHTDEEGDGATAIGLVDGLAHVDVKDDVESAYDRKMAREARFPLALAHRALAVELAPGWPSSRTARVDSEREEAGRDDAIAGAPLDEPAFADVLRARLGLTMLPKLMAEPGAAAEQTICGLIELMRCARLTSLSLACSAMVPVGRSALLARALQPHLAELVIERLDCEQLVPHICALLQKSMELHTLDLTNASLGAEQVALLAGALAHNSILTTLSLRGNLIGDISMASLGAALATMPALSALCLDSNRVGPYGAAHVADVLRTNSSLKSLSLYENAIGDSGASALAHALTVNRVLEVLALASNQICDRGATSLGEMLAVNASLTALELDDNLIADQGAVAIARSLGLNTTLTAIELADNQISEPIITSFAEGMALREQALAARR